MGGGGAPLPGEQVAHLVRRELKGPRELDRPVVLVFFGDHQPNMGGSINDCVKAGRTERGDGMVINSGRAIIYASKGEDWQEKAKIAAEETRDAINSARL